MDHTYLLLDWACRATLILAAAGLLNFLLRASSASIRHLVWTCALAGVLALPLVSRGLPRWTVPLKPGLLEAPQTALFNVQARIAALNVSGALAWHPAANGPAGSGPARGTRIPALAALWIAGAAAVLLHSAVGWLLVMRLRRAAVPARRATVAAARELAAEMGVARPVRVLETAEAAIPVTWGVFRPVIVVPSAVADDAAQLRVVLLHELAHILRRDYPLHLLGQIACALYWFHPLAWIAQRQSLRLRERAADDLVLRHGVRASEYAGHLVGLARSLAAPKLCGSLAMAHKSYLEQRVRAILDGRPRRMALSRAAVLSAAACAAVLVVGVASVSATAAGQAVNPQPATYEEQARQATLLADKARTVSGPQSLEYARALLAQGAVAYRWDRLPEAVAAYVAAVSAIQAKLGNQSPELVQPLYVLGLAAHVQKDRALATEYYGRAAEIAASNGLASSPAILARAALAQLASASGDDTRAAALLQQARAASPANSAEMAVVLDTSARILRKLGSDADAAKAEADAKTMREALPPANPSLPAAGQDRPLTAQQEIYRVGNGVAAPRLLSKVEPDYSQEAQTLKVQGTVVLRVTVGTDGLAHDITLVRGVGLGLDQKAIEAVGQWRFQPGTKAGIPVNVAATIEVNFRLN